MLSSYYTWAHAHFMKMKSDYIYMCVCVALTAVGTRCADHVTPLYPQKLALTSPTGGGRSVGIVRSRTKATEFSLVGVNLGLSHYEKNMDF